MNLIQYVASYGDLLPPTEPEAKHSSTTPRTKVGSDTNLSHYNMCTVESYMLSLNVFHGQAELPSRPTSQTSLLAETEQQMLQDLMSEAMEETDGQHATGLQQNGEGFVQ